jgi:hypothetical protein
LARTHAGARQALCRSVATFDPCAPRRKHAGDQAWIAHLKIDVLSVGSFPEATNAELASRFAVTHHFNRPGRTH